MMTEEVPGMTRDALLVTRCVAAQFPAIKTISTYEDHQPTMQQAVDIMIPGWETPQGQKLGQDISRWLQEHQAELGVQYVIWWGEIWNIERDSDGWRTYFDAGSSNPGRAHHNHVHVSVYGSQGTGPTAQAGPSGAWADPVTPATIGAPFGATGSWARYHTGLDYRAPMGAPISAVTAGQVVYAGNKGDWAGNHVAVRHSSGHTTMYSHMSRIDVTVGQSVQAGTRLGLVGSTGRSFGAHLHLELYPPGVQPGDVYEAVDPRPWLRKASSR